MYILTYILLKYRYNMFRLYLVGTYLKRTFGKSEERNGLWEKGDGLSFPAQQMKAREKKFPPNLTFLFPRIFSLNFSIFSFCMKNFTCREEVRRGVEKRKEKERYLILIRKQSEMEREKHIMCINK